MTFRKTFSNVSTGFGILSLLPVMGFDKKLSIITETSDRVSSTTNIGETGTITQTSDSNRPINTDNALEFDGGSRYLNTETSGLFTGEDKPISVVFRGSISSLGTLEALFSVGNSGDDTPFIEFSVNSAKPRIFIRDDAGGAANITTTTSIDGTDHTIVFATDGTTGAIYVDGVAAHSSTNLDVTTLTLDQDAIGTRLAGGSTSQSLDGIIKHLSVYTTKLTETDAENFHNILKGY